LLVFALLALLAALPGWAQSVEATFNVSLTEGIRISGMWPFRLAIDEGGNLYATDIANSIVTMVPVGGGNPVPITVPSLGGFKQPDGIALDGLGNLYIGDNGNKRVVKIPVRGGSPSVVPTTGLSRGIILSVDAGNNLFISDEFNNRILEISAGSGKQTTVPTTGLNNPLGLAVDKNGNVYVADNGNNRVVELPWTGTAYGAQTTVGSGLVFPNDVKVDKSGNIFIADGGNNRIEIVPVGGGAPTVTPGIYPGGSPVGMALDPEGDIYFAEGTLADSGPTDGFLELVSLRGASFGTLSAGSSLTAHLQFTFPTATTPKTITAVDEGYPGKEFSALAPVTGDCWGFLPVGAVCTVEVQFTPTAAGERHGSLIFTNTNNVVVAEVPLSGFGAFPVAAFTPATPSVLAAIGLASPEGTAVDIAGDVFVADFGNKRVVELPAGGGAQTTVGFHLSGPSAVAVDGAGNVFIADATGNSIKKVSATNGAQTMVGSGLSAPAALTTDGDGNLYVADAGNNRVVKLPPGCTASSCQSTLGTGLKAPAGVAIDRIGNLYVADTGNNRVVEIPVNGAAQIVVATGFSNPHGVVVDGALNVYVADTGNNRVVEVPVGGGAQVTLATGLKQPYGLSMDSLGNLFVGDTGNKAVVEVTRSAGPSLSFVNTPVNAVSSDSPQDVTVQNIGTLPLTFDSTVGVVLSDQADFEVNPNGNTYDCGPGTVVNSGATCLLENYFYPAAAGPLSGTVTLTDNSMSVPGATQTISLSGTGVTVNPAPALSSISPTAATVGGPAFTLTANGSNFVSGSVIRWNGVSLGTVVVSGTQLTAVVPAAKIAIMGTVAVTVYTPAAPVPGGGTSQALNFTLAYPAPVLTSLGQVSILAGGNGLALTVKGSGFLKNVSVVNWNGSARVTTFVSATQLTAAITAADIAAAGTASITVANPTPGGGTSAALSFSITNPAPTATAPLSPSSAWAGGAAFTLTINGSNFIKASQVTWNGTNRATTYVSATQLQAAILAADIAAAGTAQVTVSNPKPGGGTTSALTFTINKSNPPPAPTFSPAAGTYGAEQVVTLSDTAGAAVKIYYTTDGSTPSASSKLYTTPLLVPATETITAVAMGATYSPGVPVAATYTLVGSPTVLAQLASSVTSTSAVLTMVANDLGAAGQTWFLYAPASTGSSKSTKQTALPALNGSQTVTAIVTGLTPNTTYNVQPVVTAAGGSAIGATLTFTTTK
jgi:sugar lactone lactonase YvrE